LADDMTLEALIQITANTSGVDEAISALDRLNQAAQSASQGVSGAGSSMGAGISGATDQIKEAAVTQEAFIAEYRSVSKSMGETDEQIERDVQTYIRESGNQTQAVVKQTEAVRDQVEVIGESAAVTQKQTKAAKDNASAAKTAAAAQQAAQKAQAEHVSSVKAGATTLQSWGSNLTKAVTLPIIAAGIASGKAAIDFETAFTGVTKTVDGSDEDFAALRKNILETSTQMPFAATEIARVAQTAGQLGVKVGDIQDFTKTMLMLGTATDDLGADEAASTIAQFAAITGMSIDDSDRLAASIVALGNNFPTTEGKIASMALRLSAAGRQAGMTEAQTLGFAAALASVGIEAEMGGSAFSKMLLNIDMAVASGGDELKQFAKVSGMSADQFAKAWKDAAAGAMETFIVGLSEVESKGGNLSSTLGKLGVDEVRLRDTMMRLAGGVDKVKGAVSESTKAWSENNALQKEYDRFAETMQSQITTTMNKLNTAGINIGAGLMPALDKVLDVVGNIAGAFADMDEGLRNTLIFGGGALAAIGPLLNGLGGLAKTVIDFPTTMKNVGTAFSMLGGLFTNPVGLGITAATVGVVGLVSALNSLRTDDIKGAFANVEYDEEQIARMTKQLEEGTLQINKNVQLAININEETNEIKNKINAYFADGKLDSKDVKQIKQDVEVIVNETFTETNKDGVVTKVEAALLTELVSLQEELNGILDGMQGKTGQAALDEAMAVLERIENIRLRLGVINSEMYQEQLGSYNRITMGLGTEEDVLPATLHLKQEYEVELVNITQDYKDQRAELIRKFNEAINSGNTEEAEKIDIKIKELDLKFEVDKQKLQSDYLTGLSKLFEGLGPSLGEEYAKVLEDLAKNWDMQALVQSALDTITNGGTVDEDAIKSILTPEVLAKYFKLPPDAIDQILKDPTIFGGLSTMLSQLMYELRTEFTKELKGLDKNPIVSALETLFKDETFLEAIQNFDPSAVWGALLDALKSYDLKDDKLGNDFVQKVIEDIQKQFETITVPAGHVAFDASGAEVQIENLKVGDIVYDATGAEFEVIGLTTNPETGVESVTLKPTGVKVALQGVPPVVEGGVGEYTVPIDSVNAKPGDIVIDPSGAHYTITEVVEDVDGGTVTIKYKAGEVTVDLGGQPPTPSVNLETIEVPIGQAVLTPAGILVNIGGTKALAQPGDIEVSADGTTATVKPGTVLVDPGTGQPTLKVGEEGFSFPVPEATANIQILKLNTSGATSELEPGEGEEGGSSPTLPPIPEVTQPVEKVVYDITGATTETTGEPTPQPEDVGSAYKIGEVASTGGGMAALKNSGAGGKSIPIKVSKVVYDVTGATTELSGEIPQLDEGSTPAQELTLPINVTLEPTVDSTGATDTINAAMDTLQEAGERTKPVNVTLEATPDSSAAASAVSAAMDTLETPETKTKPVTVQLAVTVDSSGAESAIQSALSALSKSETVTKTVTVNVKTVEKKSGSSGSSSSSSSSGGSSGASTLSSSSGSSASPMAAPMAFASLAEPVSFAAAMEPAALESAIEPVASALTVEPIAVASMAAAVDSAASRAVSALLSVADMDWSANLDGVIAAMARGVASGTGKDGESGEESSAESNKAARNGIVQNVTINSVHPLSPAQAARELYKTAQKLALR
jgi:TP901 family phage tail tape measure protein